MQNYWKSNLVSINNHIILYSNIYKFNSFFVVTSFCFFIAINAEPQDDSGEKLLLLLVRAIAFLCREVASRSMYEEHKRIPDTGFQPGVLRLLRYDSLDSPVRSTTESQLSGELATARLAILEQSCNLAYRLSLS